MQLDQATARIRLRTPWEAIDLGFKLLAANYWPVFISFICISLPFVVLLNLLIPEQAGLIFWWIKPLLDVVPLFMLSRALFGSRPTIGMALKQWPRMAWRRCLWWLTLGRFDPARSFHLPITQLEGLRSTARGQRGRVLRNRDFFAPVALTMAFLLMEFGIIAGLYCISIMLSAPIGVDMQIMHAFFNQDFSQLAFLMTEAWTTSGEQYGLNAFWYIAIIVLEPFFVAAGFCLYLNRRSWLEGWDIEINFRKLRNRLHERHRWQDIESTPESNPETDPGLASDSTSSSINNAASENTTKQTTPATTTTLGLIGVSMLLASLWQPLDSLAIGVWQTSPPTSELLPIEPADEDDADNTRQINPAAGSQPEAPVETEPEETEFEEFTLPPPDNDWEDTLDDFDTIPDDFEDGVYADYCREATGRYDALRDSSDPIEQALAETLSDPAFGECTIIETRERIEQDEPDEPEPPEEPEPFDDDEPGFWERLWDDLWGDDDSENDNEPGFWERLWDSIWGDDDDVDTDDVDTPNPADSGTNDSRVQDRLDRLKNSENNHWRWVLAAAVGLLILIVLLLVWRNYRRRKNAPHAPNRKPKQRFKVGEEIVDTRKLPKNAAEKAQAMWDKGEHRQALSLLYRATLGQFVTRYWVEFPDSATEGECLRIASEQAPAEPVGYLSELTMQWQLLAYAHRRPSDAEIANLCEQWQAAMQSPAMQKSGQTGQDSQTKGSTT